MKHWFLLLLFSLALLAAPEKAWESGKMIAADSGEYESSGAGGGALSRGIALARKHDYTDYTIESERYVYTVTLSGSPHVIVNAPTKFRTEKSTLWFIDADGKERKTKILKQVLKDTGK
jgi:hypothetical protein